jgi:hypothetical protein
MLQQNIMASTVQIRTGILCYLNKLIWTDLLSRSSMPASLVTRLLANRAQIPAMCLVEVSPSVHVIAVPFHSIHIPLETFLLPFAHAQLLQGRIGRVVRSMI